MTIHRIIRDTHRLTISLILLLGLTAGEPFLADTMPDGWTKRAAAASPQFTDAYIKSRPQHRQAKYHRLHRTEKPGHECFYTNKAYHVVWNGVCKYNHAFDWKTVSMFGEFMSQHDAEKAVDGRLDTKMNSKETRKADGIVWWELNLPKAVNARKFVLVKTTGLAGGVLAVSNTVRGEKLMTDKSGKVKRFYLSYGPKTFKIDLDGKPVRHFRLYTHTAEWRRVKKISDERRVDWVGNSPFYVISEVYILD